MSHLITGANGQLGLALQQHYPDARAVDADLLDITDSQAVAAFDWTGIDGILNAAAYTNVDSAETPEGRITAWQVNAVGVANLARVATERNIPLVHISSDYVFDGTEDIHLEAEKFSPLGVYGQSKTAGDIAASLAPKHYILRTSWVIGEGKNFIRTMVSLAEKNISPTVVADQIGRLTFTTTLADAIDHLLTHEAPFGTYNVSNDGQPASWADITRAIFTTLGRTDLTVTDATTAEYFAGKTGVAPRPLSSTFSLEKIKATGFVPHNWQDDLRTYLRVS